MDREEETVLARKLWLVVGGGLASRVNNAPVVIGMGWMILLSQGRHMAGEK